MFEEDFYHLQCNGWVETNSYKSDEQLINLLSKRLGIDFITQKKVLQPQVNSRLYPISLSNSYGYNAFPFHTDGANFIIPPRFLILKYLGEFPSNTATLLLDSRGMNDNINFKTLSEEEVYYTIGGNPNFFTTINNKTLKRGESIFRYNKLIMKKLNSKSALEFEDIFSLFPSKSVYWQPNKILILDNWRILHSRGEISENEISTRKIERTYLFQK